MKEVLFILAIALVPFAYWVFSNTPPGFESAAEHLIPSINFSVDPCVDFFHFACGNWLKNNPVPPYLTFLSTLGKLETKVQEELRDLFQSKEKSSSEAINKLKFYYHTCMNRERINRNGVKELLKEIQGINYWPILYRNKWNSKQYDLTDILIKIYKSKGVNILFDITIKPDMKNSSRNIIYIDEGSLGVSPSILLDQKSAGKLRHYRSLLIQRAAFLARDAGLQLNIEEISRDVDEVLAFEKKVAAALEREDRNVYKLYNVYTLDGFIKIIHQIDWKRYFRFVAAEDMTEYFDSNPNIVVMKPRYFESLSIALSETDPRVITNYLMFRFAASHFLSFIPKYAAINQEYKRKMTGRQSNIPRSMECTIRTKNALGHAASALYVRKHFKSESKTVVLSMITELVESFRDMLRKNDWMDEETKVGAEEKLSSIRKQIGYPEFLMDDDLLDKYYDDLHLDENDSFTTMIAKISQFNSNQMFKKLVHPADRDEFSHYAHSVNAHYWALQNVILFPAAILQIPLFDASFPMALNYGGLGSIIGHEITHGFDDRGRHFDSNGEMRDWWGKSTSRKFMERAQCFVKQYGNITDPTVNVAVNGRISLGENIADNGGVRESFLAYKRYLTENGTEKKIKGLDQYNNEQIFFLGFAQSFCGHTTKESLRWQLKSSAHLPERYRVNTVLQNQPEFSEAFECPTGSPMNPVKRCTLW